MLLQKITKERMPTATTANKYPVHRWYSFIAGYSPEYIYKTINNFKDRTSYTPIKIYDPFSGCATTNVVANECGIPSIGIERNPVFYKIGLAKTQAKDVIREIREISNEFNNKLHNGNNQLEITKYLSTDAITFLYKLFNHESLQELLCLRKLVEGYSGVKYIAGYIYLSKVIDLVTHSKTDGIYKAPTSKKQFRSVKEAIDVSNDLFLQDRNEIDSYINLCDFVYGSSIDYQPDINSIDLVVFSPPYLNNFDFAEMTRMHMYFWGEAGSWGDISDKYRDHMLVNTTTALKLVRSKEQQEHYRNSLPHSIEESLVSIVNRLSLLKKEKPSKKDYDLIIYPYLYQMQEVLRKCYMSMRSNGAIHIVVSDASFYGIYVATQEYLAEIMINLGYRKVTVDRMRTRGDKWVLDKRTKSEKQLGEYEITALKE